MKVLALSPYPLAGASARYRVYAFEHGLRQQGIELVVRPFLSSTVFQRRNSIGDKDASVLTGILDGFLSRGIQAITARRQYDVIYIQRQAFPLFQKYLDPLFLHCGVPLVFDMDDAVFAEYPIDHLLSACAAVTVGNTYLAEYVRQTVPHIPVTVIPTTVDLTQYTVPPVSLRKKLAVGWIGTYSTFMRYLLPVLPSLVSVTQAHGGEFRVIASPDVKEATERAGGIFIPWSLNHEISELQQLDVGVMPLHADDYVRGKCAFKLIQYGAVGLPSVGTDIGANREVVLDSESGFLTTTPQDMQDKLSMLLGSVSLRQHMGEAARQVIADRFSLHSQVDVLASVFKAAAQTGR